MKGTLPSFGSHIIDRITRICACTGEKIEGRTTGGTADAPTGRSTAVNVLLVTQFVIVIRGVVTLAGEEWLQAVLAADVYGQNCSRYLREKSSNNCDPSPLEQ